MLGQNVSDSVQMAQEKDDNNQQSSIYSTKLMWSTNLVPEPGIEQVKNSMFSTANIYINWAPIPTQERCQIEL